MDTGLRGKVVIVTGAQHGIGAATAKAFAAEGAAVYIHYFRVQDGLDRGERADSPGLSVFLQGRAGSADSVVQEIRERGGRAESWEADLSCPDNIAPLFQKAEEAFGPVEVLVNNAAYWDDDSFLPPDIAPANPFVESWKNRPSHITADIHDQHFAVNSRAVALLMAEFFRRHVAFGRHWGRIINVSTEGAHCFPGEVSYGASKAALEAYTRSAACELAKFGITVNIVAPGATQTGWITPELERQILPLIPCGRVGQPADVADVIVLLASEQARWVTGQLLNVGGGSKM
jgi:3-oxoacyl-[acyl-carrier protein] reductase